jgi:hypothetical protein
MRFMMITKGDTEPGHVPPDELIDAMTAYNEELAKAGVLRDLTGLHSSAEGARVNFRGGDRTVVDGPFAEAKELIAGFWIIEVGSKEEAVEWAKKIPLEAAGEQAANEGVIEIRRIFELDEFGDTPAADRARKLEGQLEG